MRYYSPKNYLAPEDLWKVLEGAKVALSGVMGAVLLDYMARAILNQQFTTYGGIVIAGLLSVAVNLLRKFRADNSSQ